METDQRPEVDRRARSAGDETEFTELVDELVPRARRCSRGPEYGERGRRIAAWGHGVRGLREIVGLIAAYT